MKLKILYLTDLAVAAPKNGDYSKLLLDWEFEDDRKIIETLQSLGHHVQIFLVHNDLKPLLYEINHYKPDLIFNQCEAFNSDRNAESHFVALFELLQIPYTGASAQSLLLCKNKSLSKAILKANGISTPNSILVKAFEKPRFTIESPVIVKPTEQEASVGINANSYCKTTREAVERVLTIQKKYKSDALVEEFIEGREIYLSVMGRSDPEIYPFRELFFDNFSDHAPKFATFKSKWDDEFRLIKGIHNGAARFVSKKLSQEMLKAAKKINTVFQINGYARIDMRIQKDRYYVLEVNPNPSLGAEDDFAMSALQAKISFERLIKIIVSDAFCKKKKKSDNLFHDKQPEI